MGTGPAIAATEPAYNGLIDISKPWWKNRRLLALNVWIGLLLITASTNGYDGSMMNGLQSLTQWNESFNHPTGGKLGLLSAMQSIGYIASIPFAPYISDGLGRRTAIVIGAILMIVATTLQTVSQSIGMFIGARFLIGFGYTFAGSAAPLLITEIAFPSHRGKVTSIYNSLWFLGSVIAAWTTYGTFHIPTSWAWRIPSAVQGLPCVLQICTIWFVPESPRWLVSKGREAQALKTLAYYHANGNEQDPLVEYEFREINAAINFERTVSSNVGWLSLITIPANRRRLRIIVALAVFSQWSGNGLVSFYLNKVFIDIGITNPTTQLLINGILNIFNFVVAIASSLLCDKVGRRRLFLTSNIGMLLFWTLQTVCFSLYAQHNSVPAGHAVVVMIFLYYGFYDLAYIPLIVSYTIEILPYALRAKGFGVFNFFLSVSLIFNQYVNPIALERLGWKYYLVYVAWLAVEVIFIYFFLVETRNRSLEECAVLFDGNSVMSQSAETVVERADKVQADEAGSREEKISPI
ncbi:hypothetical protein PILCRDRAFT_444032 [Piloderma croceum F 1598]|uniref:Major facilitator superfamily (MFS) profile domain-containing protein n=1 Tax=Piloderma croceum (strain F 1598) TaxID=765440 RepID=A0A0C3FVF3_PILCF|nr:hypothetical protein PILCRDRAFT_444032 [Piloderma croceum F 1598]